MREAANDNQDTWQLLAAPTARTLRKHLDYEVHDAKQNEWAGAAAEAKDVRAKLAFIKRI